MNNQEYCGNCADTEYIEQRLDSCKLINKVNKIQHSQKEIVFRILLGSNDFKKSFYRNPSRLV